MKLRGAHLNTCAPSLTHFRRCELSIAPAPIEFFNTIGQKRPLATVGLGAGARTNRLSTYPAGRNWAADSFDWTIPIEGSVG
jgi:hypothetical protein